MPLIRYKRPRPGWIVTTQGIFETRLLAISRNDLGPPRMFAEAPHGPRWFNAIVDGVYRNRAEGEVAREEVRQRANRELRTTVEYHAYSQYPSIASEMAAYEKSKEIAAKYRLKSCW